MNQQPGQHDDLKSEETSSASSRLLHEETAAARQQQHPWFVRSKTCGAREEEEALVFEVCSRIMLMLFNETYPNDDEPSIQGPTQTHPHDGFII
jgi:hypothetical protein